MFRAKDLFRAASLTRLSKTRLESVSESETSLSLWHALIWASLATPRDESVWESLCVWDFLTALRLVTCLKRTRLSEHHRLSETRSPFWLAHLSTSFSVLRLARLSETCLFETHSFSPKNCLSETRSAFWKSLFVRDSPLWDSPPWVSTLPEKLHTHFSKHIHTTPHLMPHHLFKFKLRVLAQSLMQ